MVNFQNSKRLFFENILYFLLTSLQYSYTITRFQFISVGYSYLRTAARQIYLSSFSIFSKEFSIFLTEETWDDFPGTDEWSTEEYTGSLADTKVFTPSVQVDAALTEHSDSSIAVAGSVESANLANSQQVTQSLELRSQQSPVPIVGTLSAAQTQYLNQLTQQTSENMKTQYSNTTVQGYATGQPQIFEKTTTPAYSGGASNVSQYNANTQQYGNPPNSTYANSTYGVNSSYGGAQEQPVHQPVRTKTQRARVPPPSKVVIYFNVVFAVYY